MLWTYGDLPYVLGYYGVGYSVTFCAQTRSSDDSARIIRSDLYTLDLSGPSDRLRAMVSCWRVAGLLPLLAERCCCSKPPVAYSDFERIECSRGDVVELTPNTVKRRFAIMKRWAAAKEMYGFLLGHRIPHVEYMVGYTEGELELVLKPRSCEELVEALKCVTKALVAIHDLPFMHRGIGWEPVMIVVGHEKNEWFVLGFDEAVVAPQIYPFGVVGGAPEMVRGLHGVKVDVWGVGQLIKTCGFGVSQLLRELQDRCLDQNPDLRPTAADCYHHLLQLQSSSSLLSPSVHPPSKDCDRLI